MPALKTFGGGLKLFYEQVYPGRTKKVKYPFTKTTRWLHFVGPLLSLLNLNRNMQIVQLSPILVYQLTSTACTQVCMKLAMEQKLFPYI